MPTRMTTALVIGCGLLLSVTIGADDKKPKDKSIVPEEIKLGRAIDFDEDIFPILEEKCIACHNVSQKESKLDLEDLAGMLKGGKRGTAVVAGQPEKSLIYQLTARSKKPAMPPLPNKVEASALTPNELGLLKQWIKEGAKAGSGTKVHEVAWQPLPKGITATYSVAVSPWGRFAAAGRANVVHIYDVGTGKEVSKLFDKQLDSFQYDNKPMYEGGASHRDFVHSLAFNQDGTLLASGGFRVVKLWRRPANARKFEFKLAGSANSVAISANGEWLAIGAADNSIKLFNLKDGKPGKSLAGHTAAVSDVRFSADGTKVYSGSQDKTIRIWNSADGKQLKQIDTPAPINALVVTADAAKLVSGHADNLIRVWSLAEPAATEKKDAKDAAKPEPPKPVLEIKGHSKAITSLELNPKTPTQLLSGSEDGTARLWDINSGKLTRSLKHGGPVTDVAIKADGLQVATASSNNTAKLWDARNGKQLAEMKADLTAQRFAGRQEEVAEVAKQRFTLADTAVKAADKNKKDREAAAKKAKEAKEKSDKALTEAQKKAKDAADKAGAAKKELEAKKKEVEGLQKKAKDTADNSAAVKKELAAKQTEVQGLQKKAKDAAVKAVAANKELAAKTKEGEGLQKKVKDTADKATAANKELEAKKKEVEGLQKTAKDAADTAAAAKKELEAKKDDKDLQKKEKDAAVNAAAAKTQLEAKKKEVEGLQKKVKDSADNAAAAKTQLEAKKKEVEGLQKKAKDAADKAAAAKTEREAKMKEVVAIQKKAKDAATSAAAAKKEYDAKKSDKVEQKKVKDTAAEAKKQDDAFKKVKTANAAAKRSFDLGNKAVVTAQQQLDVANKLKTGREAIQKKAEADQKTADTAIKGTEKPIRTIAFSADGTQIVTGGDDQLVHLWNSAGQPVETFAGHKGAIVSIAFAANGWIISGSADKTVSVWDSNPQWELIGQLGPTKDDPMNIGMSPIVNRVTAMDFSTDGKWLVTGGGDPSRSGELMIWDVEKQTLAKEFVDAHSDTVMGVEFSYDGKFLISGAADKFVKLFDVATGKHLKSFEGHTHHVLDVSWKADGASVISAGADNAIKLWNVETGEQRRSLSAHSKQVTSIQYIGIGDKIVSCGGDKAIKLHTASNGRTYRTLAPGGSDFMYSVAATNDERVVVAAGEDGVVRIWNGADGKVLRTFEPPKPATENSQASAK